MYVPATLTMNCGRKIRRSKNTNPTSFPLVMKNKHAKSRVECSKNPLGEKKFPGGHASDIVLECFCRCFWPQPCRLLEKTSKKTLSPEGWTRLDSEYLEEWGCSLFQARKHFLVGRTSKSTPNNNRYPNANPSPTPDPHPHPDANPNPNPNPEPWAPPISSIIDIFEDSPSTSGRYCSPCYAIMSGRSLSNYPVHEAINGHYAYHSYF